MLILNYKRMQYDAPGHMDMDNCQSDLTYDCVSGFCLTPELDILTRVRLLSIVNTWKQGTGLGKLISQAAMSAGVLIAHRLPGAHANKTQWRYLGHLKITSHHPENVRCLLDIKQIFSSHKKYNGQLFVRNQMRHVGSCTLCNLRQ